MRERTIKEQDSGRRDDVDQFCIEMFEDSRWQGREFHGQELQEKQLFEQLNASRLFSSKMVKPSSTFKFMQLRHKGKKLVRTVANETAIEKTLKAHHVSEKLTEVDILGQDRLHD